MTVGWRRAEYGAEKLVVLDDDPTGVQTLPGSACCSGGTRHGSWLRSTGGPLST